MGIFRQFVPSACRGSPLVAPGHEERVGKQGPFPGAGELRCLLLR